MTFDLDLDAIKEKARNLPPETKKEISDFVERLKALYDNGRIEDAKKLISEDILRRANDEAE